MITNIKIINPEEYSSILPETYRKMFNRYGELIKYTFERIAIIDYLELIS